MIDKLREAKKGKLTKEENAIKQVSACIKAWENNEPATLSTETMKTILKTLKEIKDLLGIKPHDMFNIEILNNSTIQLKRVSQEDSLIDLIDHPAILGRPVTSSELRNIDDELFGPDVQKTGDWNE